MSCTFPLTANKRMKNRALIVSVENFYPGAGLKNRNGAKKDTRRLHKILSKLGFSVDIRMDIEADEIYEVFKAGNIFTLVIIFLNNLFPSRIHVLHLQCFSLPLS